MRVFLHVTLILAATSIGVACSDANTGLGFDRRPGSGSGTGEFDTSESGGSSGTATRPSSSDSSESSDPDPNPDPAPAPSSTPDSGAPKSSPKTPEPGSCELPKCIGGGGLCGCKAHDTNGDLVVLGCQDGLCACLSGAQTTATFEGTCESTEDAEDLFLDFCDCF